MANSAPTIYLYVHTHWDREWYLPFEMYRANLMKVVREILTQIESGRLESFLLDGQSCALEDIVEIEPSLHKKLSRLMQNGSLQAGPWYVLADQLLVSGESLVRNLKVGLAVTKEFGPPALVGYCPDTFGHTADMPRILDGFGIRNAYVWRGVPKLESGPVFRWESPDGTSVAAYQLARGYYQTTFHAEDDVEKLVEHLLAWVTNTRESVERLTPGHGGAGVAPTDAERPSQAHLEASSGSVTAAVGRTFSPDLNAVLIPIGGDHTSPPSVLLDKLEQVKSLMKNGSTAPQISYTTLAEFGDKLNDIPHDKLSTVVGELRDNKNSLLFERAYMLQGVLSSRLYLKRGNRLAEYKLIKQSEPLQLIASMAGLNEYPHHEMDYAWKLLLKNHPHDSICGCSVDDVHLEMESRTAKLNNLLDALTSQAARGLCVSAPRLDETGCVAPTEVDCKRATGNSAPHLTNSELPLVDPELKANNLAIFNLSGQEVSAPVPFKWCLDEHSDLEFSDLFIGENFQIDSIDTDAEIFTAPGAEPVVKRVRTCVGWAWADKVPGLGAKFVQLKHHEAESKVVVTSGEQMIGNEHFNVKVLAGGEVLVEVHDKENPQTFVLNHEIRDVADCGDTYNFDPITDDEPLSARLVNVEPGSSGPLVASLLLQYELAIPTNAVEVVPIDTTEALPSKPAVFARANNYIIHQFTTEVSVRRGVPIVFFDTEWDNMSNDHRLEVVFSTGQKVRHTYSENHYSIIKRDVLTEESDLPVGRGEEALLDRYPCQRFFAANGQLFLNMGLPEYAANGEEVSITILRAVSRLSRPRLNSRGGGAGPGVATPDANCLGLNLVSYGWAPLRGVSTDVSASEWEMDSNARAESYKLADLYESSLTALPAIQQHPTDFSLARLSNDAVTVMACYRADVEPAFFLRLLNVTESEQNCELSLPKRFNKCNVYRLDESALSRVEGKESGDRLTYRLSFGRNQLLTLKIEDELK